MRCGFVASCRCRDHKKCAIRHHRARKIMMCTYVWIYVCMYLCIDVGSSHIAQYGSTGRSCQSCSWSAEQGELIFPYRSPFVPENLVSRDGFGSPVPRPPAHLHTQAECGGHLQDSSRVPRRRPFSYFKLSHAIGSVPSLSGHASAYRWRPLPRVRRHRASRP